MIETSTRMEPRFLIQFADGLFAGGFVGMTNQRNHVSRENATQFGSFDWAELIRKDQTDETRGTVIELVRVAGNVCVGCRTFCESHELDSHNICDACC